jgi:hypothetical protein
VVNYDDYDLVRICGGGLVSASCSRETSGDYVGSAG